MNNRAFSLIVYMTDDYTIFQPLNGNREINSHHAKKLAKILPENQHFNAEDPIKVNDKMEVVDGQHRLRAFQLHAESTGEIRPIHYIIVPGLDIHNARNLNAGSKPWSPKDYAKSFESNKNYKVYLDFISKYGLNHDVVSRFLSPSGGYDLKTFRNGDFKVEDETRAKKLCNQLAEVGLSSGLSTVEWKNRGFALSFLEVAVSKNYSHPRMVEQVGTYSKLLKEIPVKNSEMTPTLKSIYNKGREDKIDLN